MKERPIIFSAESVRAILAGRKTQTRRAVQALPNGLPPRCYIGRNAERWTFTGGDRAGDAHGLLCPFGAVGDRLWVREVWALEDLGDDGERVVWKADRAAHWMDSVSNIFYLESDYEPAQWRSPIHMPRWASRITLEVAEIRVERLMDIGEDDVLAEGVTIDPRPGGAGCVAREAFALLWNRINGDRQIGGAPIRFRDDPYVWVVTFRQVQPAARAA